MGWSPPPSPTRLRGVQRGRFFGCGSRSKTAPAQPETGVYVASDLAGCLKFRQFNSSFLPLRYSAFFFCFFAAVYTVVAVVRLLTCWSRPGRLIPTTVFGHHHFFAFGHCFCGASPAANVVIAARQPLHSSVYLLQSPFFRPPIILLFAL